MIRSRVADTEHVMEKIEYTATNFREAEAKCRGTLADLVIDALIIPQCGLIPPFPVLRAILRTGGGDGGMSPGCIWKPFELSEAEYWQIVEQLEAMALEDFKFRHRDPRFTGELRADYGSPETESYQRWLDSLVHRGYLPGGPFRDTRR